MVLVPKEPGAVLLNRVADENHFQVVRSQFGGAINMVFALIKAVELRYRIAHMVCPHGLKATQVSKLDLVTPVMSQMLDHGATNFLIGHRKFIIASDIFQGDLALGE